MAMNQREEDGLLRRTVNISRVSKVVKGGKRMSFTALCVVGDKNGKVGVAKCKGADVRIAVDKAFRKAEEKMVAININGSTIPHTVTGVQCRSRVLLKPARPGTGIIASSPVRAVTEACGISDILSKNIGSKNIMNVAYATLKGLMELRPPKKRENLSSDRKVSDTMENVQ
ncbi:MAG: 30S ribosomal protein S5 [Elusimicrobia bacterium CG08_land_8_20_14_0_20_44_26]|nr:MAG: 30S ribosomal protein S5 [Elusimicrobia bacterium CG08_land_8_20_14_0_20_44_26]